MNRKAQSLVI